MIEFRPHNIMDLMGMVVQSAHEGILVEVNELDLTQRKRLETPYSWTAWDGETPVAAAGIYEGWAWAFLSPDLRRYMVPITRKVRGVLDSHPGPVLAEIDEGFPEGVRWAKLLGFRRQKPGTWTYDAHLQ